VVVSVLEVGVEVLDVDGAVLDDDVLVDAFDDDVVAAVPPEDELQATVTSPNAAATSRDDSVREVGMARSTVATTLRRLVAPPSPSTAAREARRWPR
jgi:hypothetical protein